MTKTYVSTCIRCGKERIILKKWSETRETRGGMATVSYTTMVCPDPECQEMVEKGFLLEKKKREDNQKIRLQNDLARKRAISRAKSAK